MYCVYLSIRQCVAMATCTSSCSPNLSMVVSAVVLSFCSKPPNTSTSVSPGPRLVAVMEWQRRGITNSGGVTWRHKVMMKMWYTTGTRVVSRLKARCPRAHTLLALLRSVTKCICKSQLTAQQNWALLHAIHAL